MNSNTLIVIISFSSFLFSPVVWAHHNPSHHTNSSGGVGELAEQLQLETSARVAADEALQAAIDAEAAARSAADQALANDTAAAQANATDAQNRVSVLEEQTTLYDVGPCNAGEVAKSNGAGGWVCAKDSVTSPTSKTLGELGCTEEGDIAVFSGGRWVCQSNLPAPPRFVDNGDGTVTDNDTGLMWELKQACGAGGMAVDFDNPHCVANTYIWTADGINGTLPNGTLYTDFLARLNLDVADNVNDTCFANHCDWRIPNVYELQTILFNGSCSPCIDPIFGATGVLPGYWTSSTVANDRASAWLISFNSGRVLMDSKSDENTSNPGINFARAVRGGR